MSAIVARKSFQPANEDVNRLEKGPAIKLIGWYIVVNFLKGFLLNLRREYVYHFEARNYFWYFEAFDRR